MIKTRTAKYGIGSLGWINETEESKRIRIKKLNEAYKVWYLSNNKKCSRKSGGNSLLEKRIIKICKDNNINHLTQMWIERYRYDLTFGKIILEINGDYWHANPTIYKSTDKMYSNMIAKEIWNKDLNKRNTAESNGYKIFYLWESEIKNMSDESIKNYILNLISNN